MSHTPSSHPWFNSTSKRKREFSDEGPAEFDHHTSNSNVDYHSFGVGSLHPWSGPGFTHNNSSNYGLSQPSNNLSVRVVKRMKAIDGSAVESRKEEMENGFASLSIANDPAQVNMLGLPPMHPPRNDSPLNGTASLISSAWTAQEFAERPHPLSVPRASRADFGSGVFGERMRHPALSLSGHGGWGNSDETLTDGVSVRDIEDAPEITMKSRSWYEPEKDRESTSITTIHIVS
jgi:hypothetical protein